MICLTTDRLESLVLSADEAYRRGDLIPAARLYREALSINPVHPESLCNLAIVMQRLGHSEAAIELYAGFLQECPDSAAGHSNLGGVLLECGRHDEAMNYMRKAIQLDPTLTAAWSALQIAALYHPQYDAAAVAQEARRFDEEHARKAIKPFTSWENDPLLGRRLRIGYVSADLSDHPVGRFMRPLLTHHDRERFEVFCYASGRHDAISEELRLLVDTWRYAQGETDESLAKTIRADKIDILVDLGAHTHGGRPLLFARKPSPVQVSYLAYPGTTGLSAIDHRFTDAALGESGEGVRPLRSYWCYSPPPEAPETSALPAVDRGFVTFGSFNNPAKITAPTLELWSRVLHEVKDSRIVVLCPEGEPRRRVLSALAIDPSRVAFVGRTSMRAYLDAYRGVDVALDTTPYAGGTTTADALWMGVPVVTLLGSKPVGRSGASILAAAGLPELVARAPEEYVALAAGLANDLGRLRGLRLGMRERMRGSSLMDGAGFARDVERAFTGMMRAAEEG